MLSSIDNFDYFWSNAMLQILAQGLSVVSSDFLTLFNCDKYNISSYSSGR